MFQLQFSYKLVIYEHKKQKPTIGLSYLIYLRRPRSEAARLNMGLVRIGKKRAPYSETARKNMSLARIGKKRAPYSETARKNMSKAQLGKKHAPCSEATRLNMSLARIGKKSPPCSESARKNISKSLKGRSLSEAVKLNMSNAKKGKHVGINNPNWKGGIATLTHLIRELPESDQWRAQVFKRDHFTCQDCFKKGGKLESHHIKFFDIIFQEFLSLYSNFSPINGKSTLVQLATTYAPFWELSNGKTLCKDCHKKYKKQRGNIQKEII